MTATKPYTVEQPSRNVVLVRCEVPDVSWEQWFLFTADRHFDHPRSNRALQKRHLEQARERGAGVFDFGDMHCAMQGKFDKRSSKSALRPQNADNAYFDSLVNGAVEFFTPYSDNIVALGSGNHETAVLNHHETDLTQRTVDLLNANTGSSIRRTGYSGWVRFMFTMHQTKRQAITLWHHHGYGGDAPVTKGVIQTNRQAVYLPDADIVMSGHTHNNWWFPIPRIRLNQANEITKDRQLHIKIPSYKDEYDDGFGGWEVERGAPPKDNGAWWLRFAMRDNKVVVEAREAA